MKFPLKLATLALGVASVITGAGLLAATVYTTPYAISTLAGVIAGTGSQDGTGVNVTFNRPGGVAMDGSGNTYVADSSNNIIRLIDSNGFVTILAGNAGKTGKTDGYGTNALFNGPWGVALDASTNLYVTDSGNNTVRQIARIPGTTLVPLSTLSQQNTIHQTNVVTVTVSVLVTNAVTNAVTNTVSSNTVSFTNTVTSSSLKTTNNWSTNYTAVPTNYWYVQTIAGSAQGSLNGTNATARFNNPKGIVVDGNNNLYVADTGNSTIRKIRSVLVNTNTNTLPFINWVVTTLAGSAGTNGSTDGSGTNALFNGPVGVALDASTNLYIADSGNNTIRLIDTNALVITFAGTPGVSGNSNGTGASALFNDPVGLALLGGTNLYVTDSGNYLIRKILLPSAVVTTFAGSAGTNGKANGSGTNASFSVLAGIAGSTNGILAVSDNGNNMIRLLSTNATVSALAGNGFFQPAGVALDTRTNIYVADSGNNIIRRIGTNGILTTLAGTPGTNGSADGLGSNALFNQPLGLVVDANTNIFVTDSGNYTVRKISPVLVQGPTNSQQILTVIGNTNTTTVTNTEIDTTTINGTNINTTTTNSSTTNTVNLSSTVRSTNWIATNSSTNWNVVTIAGNPGVAGGANGIGTNATFNLPDGISLDNGINIYVADTANDTIRKVSPVVSTNTNSVLTTNWSVTTPVGLAGASGSADGTNSSARFNLPEGIVVSAATNFYVADSGNNTIRQAALTGTNWVVTTLAGSAGVAGSADGIGTNARFSTPFGINIDGKGTLYISDNANMTLRKISSNGIVSTLAGTPGVIGNANGTGPNASFYQPGGVAVDKNTNNLYVADVNNNEIRKGIPASAPSKTQTIRFNAIPRQTYAGTNVLTLTAIASSALPVSFSSADQNVATVSGNILTVTGGGYVLITASQEGNYMYKPAPNASQPLTVFKGSQTITMGQLPNTNVTYGSLIPLVATNSSAVPIVFTTSNTNVVIAGNSVTVTNTNGSSITTGSAIIYLLGTGTTTITASARNANYNSASISQLLGLSVAKGLQTISFTSPSNNSSQPFTNGGTFPLVATTSARGLSVTNFTSGDSNILTINGTTATYVNAGITTITATQDGDTNYNAAPPVTNTLTVAKGPQTISFISPTNNAGIVFTNGGTFPLVATTTGRDLLVTNFISGDSNVLTISGTTATMVGAGTTTILATQDGNSNYLAATPVTSAVTIANLQSITFSSPSNNTALLYTNGGLFPLTATASSGLPVSLTVGNTNILTISGSNIAYVGVGMTTITATQAGDITNYFPATPVTNTVIVGKGPQAISFTSPTNGTTQTYAPNSSIPITATTSSGLPLTFTSSNTNVLTISGTTNLNVIGAGTATISASQGGSALYQAAPTVSNTIIITQASQTITFSSPTNGTSLTISNGGTIPLVATSDSGIPVTFSSSNTNVLSISNGTVAKMIGAGSATLTASVAGTVNYTAATPVSNTVTLTKANQSISFISPTNSNSVTFVSGGTIPLTATADSGLPVSFTSGNPSVLTINGTNATMIGVGTTTITATQVGNGFFNAATPVTNTVIVTKANQTISFSAPTNNASVPFANGGVIPLTASSSSGQPVSFTSGNPSVLAISGTNAIMIGVGTATISANQIGNANYNAATPVTNTVIVTQGSQTISFTSPTNNTSRTYTNGGTIPLTASSSSGLAVTNFISSNTNVLTISGNNATMIGVGTATITASQNGNANFSAATPVTNSVFITAANQTISFTSPTNNTSLTFSNGTIPLTATASSGLVVSFASGNTNVLTISGTNATMIGVGTATITASQAGNSNYNIATPVTNSVIVNKANQTISFTSPTNLATKTFTNGATFPLVATASSGLAVTFSSFQTNVITITNSTATMIGTGTATITAAQAGNANFNTAISTNNKVILQ